MSTNKLNMICIFLLTSLSGTLVSSKHSCGTNGSKGREEKIIVGPRRDDGDRRIFNGQLATPGQYPWQVAITYTYTQLTVGTTSRCSGALISDLWVLTSAQCLDKAYDMTAILGATKLSEYKVGRVETRIVNKVLHPYYNRPQYLDNDIAVAQLAQRVSLSSYVQPIKLPFRGLVVMPNSEAWIAGWGIRSQGDLRNSDDLYYIQLQIVTNQECDPYNQQVAHTLVCARGQFNAPCNGDDGSALIQYLQGNWTHVGVYGINPGDWRCTGNIPSRFERTESFLDFIYNYTDVIRY